MKKARKSDRIIKGLIAAVIIFGVLAIGYSIKTTFFPETNNPYQSEMQISTMGGMKLTTYDRELARKMMDKNNDGKCDACGMPVDICIDSGQMQCNMDSKSTMGVLGSQHIHADWKIYISDEVLSFEGKDHMGRMRTNLPVSSFIHIDSGAPSPEKTGDVLHMHATGVPLWIFFESLGMKFNKDCFTLDTGERYCNNETSTLKFYVNGQLNNEFGDYVFNDLDKILISYGNENEQQIQLDSIKTFAEVH